MRSTRFLNTSLCLYALSFVLLATVFGRMICRHARTHIDHYCPDVEWEANETNTWSGIGTPALDFPDAIDVGFKFLQNRYCKKIWLLHSASLKEGMQPGVWSYRLGFLANDGGEAYEAKIYVSLRGNVVTSVLTKRGMSWTFFISGRKSMMEN